MADLRKRLAEDNSLRRTARSILFGQLTRVREAASGQHIGEQLAGKIGDDTLDLIGQTSSAARRNAGIIAALAGAGAAMWFARAPMMSKLRQVLSSEEVDNIDEQDYSMAEITRQEGD